ncbi:MAG: ATP-binding protein [Acidimicrobiaceae bacterium]|nr:ATP-binding protein [Acidimicrobiaceae bacterium]
MRVEPGIAAAKLARDAVIEWLHEWDLDEVAGSIVLITSELVTNASVHAATPIEMSLSADPAVLELVVGDQDPRPPVQRAAGGSRDGGRGLIIVDRLADDWGVAARPTGKDVWARLTPPAAWSHRSTCPNRAQSFRDPD